MNEDKFDGMGKIYAKFRPNYPQPFLDYIVSNIIKSSENIIADIGSGTGIFTKQLLEHGTIVYGVEPNIDMKNIAETNLSKFNNFKSVHGTAENTTLPDRSIDVITVAQAFHWFDRQEFKRECKRILKPNGIVILVWNNRENNSEIVKENDKINRNYCPKFNGFSDGMFETIANDSFSDFFEEDYKTKTFENPLSFDQQGFIGRNLSSSYGLKETDINYTSYVSQLKILFDRYSKNGILIMPNFTKCYIGKP